MPCSDGQDYLEEGQLKRRQKKLVALESAFCAAMSFIRSKGLVQSATDYAKKHCEIECVDKVWDEHQKADRTRVIGLIKAHLSGNEIDLLKALIKEDVI